MRYATSSVVTALATALAMALPVAAMACALPPSIILTLPTGFYITGAALVVALVRRKSAQAIPRNNEPQEW